VALETSPLAEPVRTRRHTACTATEGHGVRPAGCPFYSTNEPRMQALFVVTWPRTSKSFAVHFCHFWQFLAFLAILENLSQRPITSGWERILQIILAPGKANPLPRPQNKTFPPWRGRIVLTISALRNCLIPPELHWLIADGWLLMADCWVLIAHDVTSAVAPCVAGTQSREAAWSSSSWRSALSSPEACRGPSSTWVHRSLWLHLNLLAG